MDNQGFEAAVWLSWHRSGRSIDLADALGVPLTAWQLEAIAPIRHTLSALWTLSVLMRSRPRVILLQHSLLLTTIVGAYKKLRYKAVIIVADCHTKALRRRMPGLARPVFEGIRSWAFRQVDMVIVANDGLLEEARSLGPTVVVQPDILPTAPGELIDSRPSPSDQVVIVGSFAEDEPVEELLHAAHLLPNVEFVMTGRVPASVASRTVPENVSLIGFLAVSEYWKLLRCARAIVVLTQHEDCLLRGAYEALAVCQPLVTSDTRALREYFGGSAIFVPPRSEAIAAGVLDALANRSRWVGRMTELREIRQEERATAVFGLKQAIKSRLQPS